MEELNISQKKAVEYDGKHLLVLAGAGTGKTRVIVHRASYLIQNGVSPNKIQILTFTRKAASEIVSRISMLTDNISQVNGMTFHSWCMKIIKSYPNFFGGCNNYTVIDEDDQIGLFKLICGKKFKVIEKIKLTPHQLLDIYSYARNTRKNLTESVRLKLFGGNSDENTDKAIKECKDYFITVYSAYQQRKKECKYLDYDDIIDIVITTMKNNDQIRNYIAKQYEHILVDEMQDTNPLQWEFLTCFVDHSKLFCVGDDAQSIYGFRGADFQNIHSFNTRIEDANVLRLEDNYRSTQEILDLSNWLLSQSSLKYDKKLIAVRGKGEKPIIMNFLNEWDEAQFIIENIVKDVMDEGKSYEDNMILGRSNWSLKKLEGYLLIKGIPYKIYGGHSLLASAHIRDLLSALRIVSNMYDEIAWMRYLQLFPGIGDVTATKMIEDMIRLSNIDECIEYLHSQCKYIKDVTLISILGSLKDVLIPTKAINIALQEMENTLQCRYKDDWGKRKLDFEILQKIAESHNSITEFIAEYILNPSLNIADVGGENKNGVILTTIHSAKGLEADTCYIIDVSVGMYPNVKSIKAGMSEIEEDRRVLYVAMTRAKNRLILSRKYDTINDSDSNYFLNNLPEDIVENKVEDIKHLCDNTRLNISSIDMNFGINFD